MRALFIVPLIVAACAPDLSAPASAITRARLLAVRAEPPEAAPGDEVTYTALVVGPDGAHGVALDWAYCAAPKPLGENDVVSASCLGDAVRPAGSGASTRAPIPTDACALFGPDPPPGEFRPRDPDVTGGYYQPLRATLDGVAPSFVLERVACPLANAPTDVATDFGKRYRRNANPRLAPLAASIAGAPIAPDRVVPGARVTFTASWAPSDAEAYVTFDAASQALVDRREAMRVSWFATAGTFDVDRTGRAEDDAATTSDDGWTAPTSPGKVHLWIVLRDSRGGLDFASYEITVAP